MFSVSNCRSHLDLETDRYLQELPLHFSMLISAIVNSLPKGKMRLQLFSPEMRSNLFYLFSNWCGVFGPQLSEAEHEMRSLLPVS